MGSGTLTLISKKFISPQEGWEYTYECFCGIPIVKKTIVVCYANDEAAQTDAQDQCNQYCPDHESESSNC